MNMCENGVIRPMSPEEIAELSRQQAEAPSRFLPRMTALQSWKRRIRCLPSA